MAWPWIWKTVLEENNSLKIYNFWFQNLMQININQDTGIGMSTIIDQ